MAETTYYKLSGSATNFCDLGQPDPSNRSIANNAVKALVLTRKVRNGLKNGAIEKADKKEYDAFQKENKAAKKAAADAKVVQEVKTESKKSTAAANKKIEELTQSNKEILDKVGSLEEGAAAKDDEIAKLKELLKANNIELEEPEDEDDGNGNGNPTT